MTGKPESTQQLLNHSTFLGLVRRIDLQAELLARVKKALPPSLGDHCLYCVAREDGRLVVFTDSPAWATQLRFYAPAILAAIRERDDFNIKEILPRNFPPTAAAAVPAKSMKTPPSDAIEMIKISSSAAPCPELGEALARLGAAMERYARKNLASQDEGRD